MKSTLLSMTAAALLCCTPFVASARDTGRSVGAQFDSVVANKLQFKPVTLQGSVNFGVDAQAGAGECAWHVLNIPVRVGSGKVSAINGDKVTPNYVPEMTFHVYLLVDAENATDKSGKPLDKKKRVVMLDKEITYVDIPLKKSQSTRIGDKQVDSVGNINVAVFLSPNDMHRLVDKDTAEYDDPKTLGKAVKVLAIAMDAKYSDAACWFNDKAAKEDYLVVSPDVKSWLADNWWKRSGETRGAKLMSISETPFAAYYYPSYCATRPLFGSSSGGSSYTPAPAPSPVGDTTDTTADTTTDTTTTDTTTDTADTTETRGSSRRSSSRRSRSRN